MTITLSLYINTDDTNRKIMNAGIPGELKITESFSVCLRVLKIENLPRPYQVLSKIPVKEFQRWIVGTMRRIDFFHQVIR